MFATTMLTNSDNQGWSALDRFMAFDRNKGWTTLLQESFQHLASLSFVPGDRTLMNRLQSLMVLPLAVAAFVATVARGQLTCDAPQQAVLGVTPFASLLLSRRSSPKAVAMGVRLIMPSTSDSPLRPTAGTSSLWIWVP